jgi:DNA-binding MarR family transcriptional regulator
VFLDRLLEDGPMRLSELAAAVQLDVSTASRQVRTLADGGFLESAGDPEDGRARLLQVTEQGRAEAAQVVHDLGEVLGGALQHWAAADVEQLTVLLTRLADDLLADPPPPSPPPAAEP